MKENTTQTRVAVISIIIDDISSAAGVNEILHEYSQAIVGRMGIPYRARGISIICVAVDAPQNTISALSGKLGRLSGVSSKTAYSHVFSSPEDQAC